MVSFGAPLVLLLIAVGVHLLPIPVAPPVRAWGTAIPALFALQILLKDGAHALLNRRLRPFSLVWKVMVAPGTVLHELCHAAAAVATGARLRRVVLFRPDPWTGTLGYVEYQNPPGAAHVLRNVAIGFAPFFGCGAVAVGLVHFLAPGSLPDLAPPDRVAGVWEGFLSVARAQVSGLAVVRWSDPLSWLLLYLLLTLGFGAAPSSTDFSLGPRSALRSPFGAAVAVALLLAALLGGGAILAAYQAAGLLLFSSIFWLLVSTGILLLAQRG